MKVRGRIRVFCGFNVSGALRDSSSVSCVVIVCLVLVLFLNKCVIFCVKVLILGFLVYCVMVVMVEMKFVRIVVDALFIVDVKSILNRVVVCGCMS